MSDGYYSPGDANSNPQDIHSFVDFNGFSRSTLSKYKSKLIERQKQERTEMKLPSNFHSGAILQLDESVLIYQFDTVQQHGHSSGRTRRPSSSSISTSNPSSCDSIGLSALAEVCQKHFEQSEVVEKEVLPWFVYSIRNKSTFYQILETTLFMMTIDKILKLRPEDVPSRKQIGDSTESQVLDDSTNMMITE